MEDIQCIFCNKKSEQIVIKENGYQGKKCSNCNLIFISPRPALNEIIDRYAQRNDNNLAQSDTSFEFRKRLYAKHHLSIICRYIKKGYLLEIGAGAGFFLDEARKKGFDSSGIEINRIKANFIRSKFGIPCEDNPFQNSSYEGKTFDVIYHCDVISHFYHPISEFQKINNKLNKNGLVVFETGNIGDVKEKYYKVYDKFQYPDHLFFFSEKSLKKLLQLTGFELIKIHRYSILLEYLLFKIIKNVSAFIKVENSYNGKEITNQVVSSGVLTTPSVFIEKIKRIFFCVIYLNRYGIGYILPKRGRPQTTIVIARKKMLETK